jgi:hypothetical protein
MTKLGPAVNLSSLILTGAATANPATHSATTATHQNAATARNPVADDRHETCEGGEEEG